MSKFTPGPWAAQSFDEDHPEDGIAIIGLRLNDDGRPMFTPTNGQVAIATLFATEMDACDSARAEANARLIGAAPELLDALIAVVSVADRKTDEFDAARAAIAKALGIDQALERAGGGDA